jgi:hypothetical protein
MLSSDIQSTMAKESSTQLPTQPMFSDMASEQELPPRDGGRAAWTTLTAVSMIITITWGVLLSFFPTQTHCLHQIQVLEVAQAFSENITSSKQHSQATRLSYLLGF